MHVYMNVKRLNVPTLGTHGSVSCPLTESTCLVSQYFGLGSASLIYGSWRDREAGFVNFARDRGNSLEVSMRPDRDNSMASRARVPGLSSLDMVTTLFLSVDHLSDLSEVHEPASRRAVERPQGR